MGKPQPCLQRPSGTRSTFSLSVSALETLLENNHGHHSAWAHPRHSPLAGWWGWGWPVPMSDGHTRQRWAGVTADSCLPDPSIQTSCQALQHKVGAPDPRDPV